MMVLMVLLLTPVLYIVTKKDNNTADQLLVFTLSPQRGLCGLLNQWMVHVSGVEDMKEG